MTDALTCESWLVVEHRPSRYSAMPGSLHVIKTTAKKPAVSRNQIAVKLELALPRGLFTEPTITARVALEGDVAPEAISAETIAGVEAAIQAAGFTVRVVSDDAQ